MGASFDSQAVRRSQLQRSAPKRRSSGERKRGDKGSLSEQILSLQQRAGNRVVSTMASEAGRSELGAQAPARRSVAPALDPKVEAEADAIADRATERAKDAFTKGPEGRERLGASKHASGPPRELARALDGHVPRSRVASVRFDTSQRAGAEASSIDALAFSEGSRVAFAPGELNLSTRAGFHLAAHETAHAALHPAPAGYDVGGGRLVHAKLRGTRAAAEQQGGGPTTKGVRQKLGLNTYWDQILNGLDVYEGLEERLMTGGQPSSRALAAAKPKLMKALAKIQSAILNWQNVNDRQATEATVARAEKKRAKQDKLASSDDRSKAARRQTVAMILGRVRSEQSDIELGRWESTLGLSESQLLARGAHDEGGVNKVQELTYATEQGEFSGFFKEEMGFAKKPQGHEGDVGISQFDPNYGNRAMAMYRLDQLLGAGVTARVEYAVHENKMGTVMESAKGVRADKANFVHTDKGKSSSEGSISLEDETLQRCLNKLQILDAIAGQLDRHEGNFFVQQNEAGKVTGVTGIDLDMAFGSKMMTPDAREANIAHNYRGMPKEIDEQFGQRVLAINSAQITEALSGLLSKAEVAATVSRFEWVKNKITEAQQQGTLRQQWGEEGSRASMPEQETSLAFGTSRKTYAANIALGASGKLKNRVRDETRRLIDTAFKEVPAQAIDMFKRIIAPTNNATGLAPHIVRTVYSRELPEDKVDDVIGDVVDELAGDVGWRSKVEVFVQENENGVLQHNEFGSDKVIADAFTRSLAKHGAVRAG